MDELGFLKSLLHGLRLNIFLKEAQQKERVERYEVTGKDDARAKKEWHGVKFNVHPTVDLNELNEVDSVEECWIMQ